MTNQEIINKYSNMSIAELKNTAIKQGQLFKRTGEVVEIDFTIALFFGLLMVSISDGNIDSKEIEFVNYVNSAVPLGQNLVNIESARSTFYDNYATILDVLKKYYFELKKFSEPKYLEYYANITNNIGLDKLFVEFLYTVAAYNGTVSDSEINLINEIISANEGFEEDVQSAPDPKVLRIGGTVYESDYGLFFSIGAEIKIEDLDVNELDIRVQILDSDGFILDTFDETIFNVETGIFYFGKEYRVNSKPKSFRVFVNANDRLRLVDESKPSKIFKVTGIRFMKRGTYSIQHSLACMIENTMLNSSEIGAYVYVTLYDNNNNIIGGSQLEGSNLYLNNPDKYECDVDCVSLVNETAVFRWSCDVFVRTRF